MDEKEIEKELAKTVAEIEALEHRIRPLEKKRDLLAAMYRNQVEAKGLEEQWSKEKK